MAHVDKISTGRGLRYRARWRDPDGSEKSKTFDRKSDADRFASKVEHDVNVGGYIDPHAGRVTVRNLRIIRIDNENNIVLVCGAVPGPNGSLVMIRPTNKRG